MSSSQKDTRTPAERKQDILNKLREQGYEGVRAEARYQDLLAKARLNKNDKAIQELVAADKEAQDKLALENARQRAQLKRGVTKNAGAVRGNNEEPDRQSDASKIQVFSSTSKARAPSIESTTSSEHDAPPVRKGQGATSAGRISGVKRKEPASAPATTDTPNKKPNIGQSNKGPGDVGTANAGMDETKLVNLMKSLRADILKKIDVSIERISKDVVNAQAEIKGLKSQNVVLVNGNHELLRRVQTIQELAGTSDRDD